MTSDLTTVESSSSPAHISAFDIKNDEFTDLSLIVDTQGGILDILDILGLV